MNKPYPHQPLGNFIRAVDVRNSSGAVSRLLGVSVNKCFIPSVANTIGTDMTNYKVVRKGQFVYVPVTSRNGEKITIAHFQEEECIVSQAYTVFEVIEGAGLLAKYLMLWFLRPEFDRYARFHSHGSAREVFDWETLCATLIPVPPLAEQECIVSQFATIEERMRQCRERIALLERTATALYRKTFVEGIDRSNLPDGWRMGTLGEVGRVSSGKTLSDKSDVATTDYPIPVAGASGIIGYAKQGNQEERILTTGRVGTIGVVKKYDGNVWTADNVLIIKSIYYEYCYQFLQAFHYEEIVQGGVQSLITQTHLSNSEMLIPSVNVLETFEELSETIAIYIQNVERQLTCLDKLQAVLLTQIK